MDTIQTIMMSILMCGILVHHGIVGAWEARRRNFDAAKGFLLGALFVLVGPLLFLSRNVRSAFPLRLPADLQVFSATYLLVLLLVLSLLSAIRVVFEIG
jgi:hypothetical protein